MNLCSQLESYNSVGIVLSCKLATEVVHGQPARHTSNREGRLDQSPGRRILQTRQGQFCNTVVYGGIPLFKLNTDMGSSKGLLSDIRLSQ